jgi:hypothetical protein
MVHIYNPALERLKQADHKFKAYQGPCLKRYIHRYIHAYINE